MSQQPQQPPAQPTSAAAPQGSAHPQPSGPGQRAQLPPRPVGVHQAPSSQTKEQAPPRRLAEARPGGNPFADPARRRAQLDLLRADRNVEPPKERENVASDSGSVDTDGPRGDGEPQRAAASGGDKPAGGDAARSHSGGNEALNVLAAQYQAREAAVQAAEAKVREATTSAEKRAAEAQATEKRNEAKLKRLEMLAHDPVQFLSEAGISKEDFKGYLANGGQQTPEQKRIAAAELAMQQMRDQMQQMRDEAAQHRQQAARDAEDNLFAQQLTKDEYTLVGALGGVKVVRAHQAQLSQQLGKPVSLADAAGQLESEFAGNFKKILALQAVRAKLGLQPTDDKPARESKPQSRTLDGAHSSSTPAANGARPAWNDWKGKLALLKKEQQRAKRQ